MPTNTLERFEQIAHTPIGNPGESTKPFVEALNQTLGGSKKGLSRGKASMLKHGTFAATRVLVRVLVDLADQNDSSKKDLSYLSIARQGVKKRERGLGMFAHRYTSVGYLERVAENLNLGMDLNVDQVRDSFRAMRVDITFGDYVLPEDSQTIFITAAEEYLRTNIDLLQPSLRQPVVLKLNEQWDRQSPISFYRKMAEVGKGRFIPSWTPYEAGAMLAIYGARAIDPDTQPTPFDKRVMRLDNLPDYKLCVQEIVQNCGFGIDEPALLIHRNALVFGQPVTGIIPKRSK